MSIKPVLLHFEFDDFASRLPPDKDRQVCSETQYDCNGHKWKVDLLSLARDREDGGWISLYLGNRNTRPLEIKYIFEVKDANGKTVEVRELIDKFEGYSYEADDWEDCRGCENLMERSTILDPANNILKDGALCIDVTIQVKERIHELYDPKETERHQNKMLELLNNEEKADIICYVGEEKFHVNSLILENYSPLLTAYCRQCNGSNNGAKGDIDADVFLQILEYVYSGLSPVKSDILHFDKELIDAANRFELVELKLAVERVLVHERILDKENVCDYILFADAQSCALLKEYALSYFMLQPKEILDSHNSKSLRESGELLSEIMRLMPIAVRHEVNIAPNRNVNELRKELSKRGLDVDGSKEALVARLEAAQRQMETD